MNPALKQKMMAHMRVSAGERSTAGSETETTATILVTVNRHVVKLKDAYRVSLAKLMADPNQPRKEFDEIELRHLADDLAERGQLQPIRARWDGELAMWVIITGERRYRAALMAGLAELDIVEDKSGKTKFELLEDQLVENCQRADLKPIERSRAFRDLMESQGYTTEQLAKRINMSIATVSQSINMLRLIPELQESVDQGELSTSAGYQLSKIEDAEQQKRLAKQAKSQNLNREEFRELVASASNASKRPKSGTLAVPARGGTVTFRLLGAIDHQKIREAMKDVDDWLEIESARSMATQDNAA